MKLKVQHLMDATLIVSQIIRDRRPMPQRGKFRLARLHAKLLPEFQTINDQRDAMIRAYDTHQVVQTTNSETGEVTVTQGAEWTVPDERVAEFNAAWAEIAQQDIEVAVEPIPLDALDLGDGADGTIEASEIIVLGDLISD